MFLVNIDHTGDVRWATDQQRRKRDFFHRRAVDRSGNAYETGRSTSGRALLTKHSGEGLLQWSRDWYGTGDAGGNSVAVDSFGNVFIMGHFSKDLKVGSTRLTSTGAVATYINKLDAGGNVLWSMRVEGIAGRDSPGKVTGYGIVVDGMDDVFVTGAFEGTLIYGAEKLVSAGGQDIFVMKLHGSNGDILWAMAAGGAGQDSGNSIAIDKYGDFYVTGSFTGLASFGGKLLESRGDLDVFWMKLSSNYEDR